MRSYFHTPSICYTFVAQKATMAAKKDRIRQRAEDWYIDNSDCTQAEIAEKFGITAKTVGDWVKKHGWEKKRLDYHSSPVKIRQLLQEEFISIAQGNKSKLDADAISKINAALERMDRKADPYVVQSILKELDNYISQIDPKFAAQCTPFHKLFLQHRINLEA